MKGQKKTKTMNVLKMLEISHQDQAVELDISMLLRSEPINQPTKTMNRHANIWANAVILVEMQKQTGRSDS